MPSRQNTLKDAFLNTPIQIIATRLMYVVLLVAFLVIGYLLGSLFPIQGGAIGQGTTPTAAAPQTAPEVAAPEPETVLEKLKNPRLPAKGNANAPVTIVEFSDFECPFCARFYSETLPQIQKEYVDTGKVKIVYMHYPLSFHAKARPLANAAECANDQGKFWEMHDKIFSENTAGTLTSATDETYKQWAQSLGLNTTEFNTCYDSKTFDAEIDKEFALGGEVGVSATPTFYINGRQLVGAMPFESFKAIIDEELNK